MLASSVAPQRPVTSCQTTLIKQVRPFKQVRP